MVTVPELAPMPRLLADPLGNKRSPEWPAARKAHLKLFPACAVCGVKKPVEVHHIKPFHTHPELELDPANLITLCESDSHNDHFLFGHLLDWRSANSRVRQMAGTMLRRIRSRP